MAETETMAPRKMAFEITVPYTMGTLDKKRIGLTSANLRQAKGNCQRAGRGGWESNARRNARRRLTAERAPGSLQHQTIGKCMKACAQTVGTIEGRSSAGAQGRRAE